MKRAGNTFRILFIIQAVCGLRLDSDSDLSKDISGASEPEFFNATGDVSDYYDVQGALMENTDEIGWWHDWVATPFDYAKSFLFEACEDSSSLAAVGSDMNSSSEFLIRGLDDAEQEQQLSATTVKIGTKVSSKNAQVRYHTAGYLETKGTTSLSFTVNFHVSKKFKYKKRWTSVVFHAGAVAVFINVGIKMNLSMKGNVGFHVTVPLHWDFCVTTWAQKCYWRSNHVWTGSISFNRRLGVKVRGNAEVSASLQVELGGSVTTSAEVTSTMTLHDTQCTVRYDWHLRCRALSTVLHYLNLAKKLITNGAGICFNEFTDIHLADLLKAKIWEGSCSPDYWR